MAARRLLFVAPSARFFLSHRAVLGEAAIADGFDVAVACPADELASDITSMGMRHFDIPLWRAGMSPLRELRTLRGLVGVFRAFKPDLAHLITAKPALHGGIASRLSRTPSITAVTGLGNLFTRDDWRAHLLQSVLLWLYRFALRRRENHFIFQNSDDREIFATYGLLDRSEVTTLPGSGVDLAEIKPEPMPAGAPLVLMPSRMLADKGVREFAEAARMLKSKGVVARFMLLGDVDPDNPTSLSLEELEALSRQGDVVWQPHRNDIGAALAEATVVALPSYREGFPKSLVDAAAAGRAMVTTDVPGCRDAVIAGKTGILCRPRDAKSLAGALEHLLRHPALCTQMGAAARADAVDRFDVRTITERHLELYRRFAR